VLVMVKQIFRFQFTLLRLVAAITAFALALGLLLSVRSVDVSSMVVAATAIAGVTLVVNRKTIDRVIFEFIAAMVMAGVFVETKIAYMTADRHFDRIAEVDICNALTGAILGWLSAIIFVRVPAIWKRVLDHRAGPRNRGTSLRS
jgi:hypothetical protein